MEFSVLGPLDVRHDGGELRLGAPKPRVLLTRLLLDANRVVPADRLVEDLWDGEPPPSSAQTLQSYVSQLRKVIGSDRVVTEAGGYRLVVGHDESDLDRFEALATQGVAALRSGDAAAAAAALRAALDLWRGAAFADALGASWAAAEAARLEELRLVATEALLEARLSLHDDRGVIAEAEAAVAEHPLRERLWALLMTALYRQGRQADALRAYQRVRRHLRDEFGIDPGRELQELEARLLRQDADLSPPAAGDAPAPARVPPPAGSPLPTGVVTFMLTDVVGSTRLWEIAPTATAEAIARHEELVRRAVEEHRGVLLKSRGEGDSTFSVFQRATDAVAGALAALASLRSERWGTPSPIEIRLALHSGEAIERDGDYYGRAVNRAARLRAAAAPAQVVVSQATAELVLDDVPKGFRLQPLGVQQLRDLDRPETVFVVAATAQGEPAHRPPDAAVPLPPRLATPPAMGFIGREAERRRCARAFEEAAGGGPRVVLLGGEPGVGKTALAARVAEREHGRGATVLFGRCDDDSGVPHRPWVEALGHYLERAPREVLERLGTRTAADLLPLAPVLRDRLPGVAASRSADAEADRWSLYAAVARLFVEVGRDAPVLLVLDDLHWADKPSLVLLRHVIDAARGAPLVVLGTYRDSDLTTERPFAEALAWLLRDASGDRIELGGLVDREVVDLVEAFAGQPLGDDALDLLQAVYRETDGNPFFVEALLRHLAESGAVFLDDAGGWAVRAELRDAGLPRSVREVIGHRVSRLGDGCRRVLEAASVAGREFDLVTVATALGADEDDVLDALEAADAAGLVVNTAADRFTFAHAIVATTLYGDLAPTRRARLHRDVAEAIEATDPGGERVAELARHWSCTGAPADRTKAMECARRAGDRARAALAPDEAVRWYGQAVELLGGLDAGTDVDATRVELLVRLGRAQRDTGDPAHRATLIEAARLAQRCGDAEQLVRAALANTLGFVGVVDTELGDRIAILEAALAAIPDEDSAARTRLLATLAAEMRIVDDAEDVRRLADEALAMARRLHSPHLLAVTSALVLFAIWGPDTLEERLQLSEETIEHALALGEPGLCHIAGAWRTHALVEAGRVDEAAATLDLMADIAAETRQPNLQWTSPSYRASLALLHGDLDAARRLGDEALSCAVADMAFDPEGVHVDQLVAMAWHQGRLEDVVGAVEEERARRAAYDEKWIVSASDGIVAARRAPEQVLARFRVVARSHEVFVRTDLDPDEARAGMRVAADMDPAVTTGWVGSMVLWADVCLRVGADDDAAHLLERLAPYHGQVASSASSWLGSVAGALAPLAVRLGRLDDAERWFAEADELNERIRAPFFLARNRVAWARMLLAHHGGADRAAELLRSAVDLARQHGCTGVVEEAELLLAGPPPLPARLATAARIRFVGRTADLAALQAALARGGEAVLVAGEPGIGKSALVAAAAADAHTRGAWVLHGRCDEDVRVPFLPFVEALAGLVAHVPDATLDAIGDRHLAELARLVPTVRDRRPSVALPQSTDPETERYLLLNAAVAALVGASGAAPLVLVVDDLHWADASSVLLLRHLVTALPASAVTVLGTYRHTDLFADTPLAAALPRLQRERAVRQLTLGGLTTAELAEMTGAPTEVADELHRETDGNPFFAAELSRHLLERGGDAGTARTPEAVRGLVRQRASELGDDVLTGLAAASAIGQEFDLELLALALGHDPLDLADELDRAAAAALVTPLGPQRFAFSHAIVQHALYDELTPARRSRTHRQLAAALEQLSPGGERIAELARHWVEAAVTSADVAVAVERAVQAAASAVDALAPDEAVRWYTTALDLLAAQAVPDQRQRLAVLLGLGEAQMRAGDPAFRRTTLRAGELAITLDDTDGLVRAALTSYERAFTAETDTALIRLMEQALERVGGRDSSEHAQLLGRYADAFQFADPARCIEVGDEAMAMAERVGGDLSTLVRTITFGAMDPDRWEGVAARIADVYRRAREGGDPSVLFGAARLRADSALRLGDRDGFDDAVAALRGIATEIGRPDMRWVAMVEDATLALLDGELRRAEQLTAEATVLGRELRQDGAELLCATLLTSIRWHQGRHRETRDVISSSAKESPEVQLVQLVQLPVTMDETAGLDLLGMVRSLRRDGSWLPAAAILADIADRADDAPAARALHRELLPHAHLLAVGGPQCRGSVAHALGLTARTFGDLDAAKEHFAAADSINARLRAPFFQARTWLEWGTTLGPEDGGRARQLLERAREVALDRGFEQVERRARRALADLPA